MLVVCFIFFEESKGFWWSVSCWRIILFRVSTCFIMPANFSAKLLCASDKIRSFVRNSIGAFSWTTGSVALRERLIVLVDIFKHRSCLSSDVSSTGSFSSTPFKLFRTHYPLPNFLGSIDPCFEKVIKRLLWYVDLILLIFLR